MTTTLHGAFDNVFDNEHKDINLPTYSVGDLLIIQFTATSLATLFTSGFFFDWDNLGGGPSYGYIRIADGTEGSVLAASDYNPSNNNFTGVAMASSWSPSSGYEWVSWGSITEAEGASYYNTSGTPVEITGSDGFDPADLVSHILWGWVYDQGTALGGPWLTFDNLTGTPSPDIEESLSTGDIGSGQADIFYVLGDVFDLPGDNGSWTFDIDWLVGGGAPSGGPTVYFTGLPVLETLAPVDDFATNGQAGYWG